MAYQVQVICNEWAGGLQSGWRPAIAGALNQTGLSDEEASTFDTEEEARAVLADLVIPQNPDEARVVAI